MNYSLSLPFPPKICALTKDSYNSGVSIFPQDNIGKRTRRKIIESFRPNNIAFVIPFGHFSRSIVSLSLFQMLFSFRVKKNYFRVFQSKISLWDNFIDLKEHTLISRKLVAFSCSSRNILLLTLQWSYIVKVRFRNFVNTVLILVFHF